VASPPRWYPDPARRHQFRYWDGGRWTERVSDNGVEGLDGADFGDQVRHVYVDAQVSVGLRGRRLLVTDEGLTWGDRRLGYADLVGIAYWVVAALGPNRTYELRLWAAGQGPMMVRFIGRDAATRATFDATVTALLQHAGRRLMNDAINRVEAGETVEFGGWTLDRQSAAHGRKRVAWTTPIDFVPSRQFFGGWSVRAVVDGRRKDIGMILQDVANGPLLRTVFDACIARYGASN
jgi:Protein of unknown function (DUF2510)